MYMPGPPKRFDPRKRPVHRAASSGGTPPKRESAGVLFESDSYEYEEIEEVNDGSAGTAEDPLPVDIEQSKRQLRRMSLQMAEIDSELLTPSSSPKKDNFVVKDATLASLKDPMGFGSEYATGEESEDDTIIEEVYDEEEIVEEGTEVEDETEVEEVLEEEEEEVLEEILEEEEDLLENIAEGTERSQTEVDDDDDEVEEEEDEEEDEEDEEDMDATEEEVREAIVYIFKQERPIDNGYLTSDQATRMMALPFADLKEIMKHFEVCDNTGEPICWNLIVDVVTPDGESPDDDDENDSEDDDDEGQNGCIHGYGYCLECGVTDSKDANDSSSSGVPSEGEARDEVGSLGSGFDLNFQVVGNDSYNNNSVSSFNEGSDSEGHDLKEYKLGPTSPRSRGSM